MIPGVMVDFLARASVAAASLRDEKKVPRVLFLSGWSVDEKQEGVVCLLGDAFAENVEPSLRRHGAFSMVAEQIGPHECYQFKGRYAGSRPASDADRSVFEACRARFMEAVTRHSLGRYTDAELRAHFRPPALAVHFTVDEIFVQTPGPAAGGRLYPAER